MSNFRPMGPYNGAQPQATGMAVAFIRNPASMAYLNYAQLVPAPGPLFMYCEVDPDTSVRLVNLNEFAWGYDDYRPTGRGWAPRTKWIESRIERWDFPYQIGDMTSEFYQKNGIDPRQLYDAARVSQAALHRASRVVNALQSTLVGEHSVTLQSIAGEGADLSEASGQQYLVDGTKNPNFRLLGKVFDAVRQRVFLATNGVVSGGEMIAVMSPKLASAWAQSGECFEALKQSQYAPQVSTEGFRPRPRWNVPTEYAGISIVIEDTPRVFVEMNADGSVASVTAPNERDYILSNDDIYFVTRIGGIDAFFGGQNYSTCQVYYLGSEIEVQAFSEPKHTLVECHALMQDRVLVPAKASGLRVTNCLNLL